ncbi:hypothetical protein LWM68_26670 [Niabella sp. W65]|nr:hypothetical protein [Niabella sp. W65]MCH7366038.1 hypothetical protein [Niabella sp. W65]
MRYNWTIDTYGKAYTRELFNSDLQEFDGTGHVFNKDITTELLDEETKNIALLSTSLPWQV